MKTCLWLSLIIVMILAYSVGMAVLTTFINFLITR
jgi:hypothetical protein